MRSLLAIALAFLLAACGSSATPAPSQAPSISASPAPSAPSAEPSPASSLPPASIAPASPPTSTLAPSPSAAPIGDWVGLHWAIPALAGLNETFADVLARPDGHYLAVGQFQNPAGGLQAAAWMTSDWQTWRRTWLDTPAAGDSTIWYLRAIGTGLVALGSSGVQHCVPPEGEGQVCDPLPLAVWTSTDGTIWQLVRPTGLVGVTVTALVSGPAGLILAGDTGWAQPGLWTSADGRSWTRQKLPAATFADAHFLDLAASPSGFVLSGYRGGKAPVCCISAPSLTTPAAWFSPDGQTWQAAVIAGAKPTLGSQINQTFAGLSGLVAINEQYTPDWVSADGGRHWAVFPASADASVIPWAADGTRIIGKSAGDNNLLNLWTSPDGLNWQALEPSGAVEQMPGWSAAGVSADLAFVYSGGLGLIGWPGSDRTPLWFAAAAVRP